MTLAVKSETGVRYKITGWKDEQEIVWIGVIMGENISNMKIAAVIRHNAEMEKDVEKAGKLKHLAEKVERDAALVQKCNFQTWHVE